MGRGNVDLDRSLDDIIKHSKKRPSNDKRLSTQSSRGGHGGRPNVNARVSKPNSNNSRDRGNATTINRRIGASTTDRNSSNRINSRLTRGSASRPPRADINLKRNSHGSISVKRGQSSRPSSSIPKVRGPDMSNSRWEDDSDRRSSSNRIDPKSLVITKAISRRETAPSTESPVIQSNTPNQRNAHQRQQQRQQQQPQQRQQSQPDTQAYQNQASQYNSPPVQQTVPQSVSRNIVLLCNLDPRATAADVGEACSTFGPILSCDILLDPMGRPLNEAEIEFLYPNSAEDCVAKLDNSIADGRLVRARLQSSATLPVVPRYSSRTVVGSARVAQGGFDNPQPQPLPMNYQDHYQNNNSGYSRSQQDQYQRRY